MTARLSTPIQPADAPPAWQDIAHLQRNLCISRRTIDEWVRRKLLPPPRMRGGKRFWEWKEVERYMRGEKGRIGSDDAALAEKIRNATREAANESR